MHGSNERPPRNKELDNHADGGAMAFPPADPKCVSCEISPKVCRAVESELGNVFGYGVAVRVRISKVARVRAESARTRESKPE